MAVPYSTDLRKRVLAECEKKVLKRYQIAELFQITERTIYTWVQTKTRTGRIEPKTGYQKGHSHKITDIEKFKLFIERNPNASLKELSKKWGNISSTTIGDKLREMVFTVKKNSGVIRKEVRKRGLNIKKK